MLWARPWRTGVAVFNVGGPPSEVEGVPELRPVLLLRDKGFDVHAVARATRRRRSSLEGVTVWEEPDTAQVVRRIVSLRPELLFVESITYGALLGPVARRSWIRNPLPAANPRMHVLQRRALRTFDAVTFTNPVGRNDWPRPNGRDVDLPYPVDVRWWSAKVPRREDWWTERGLPTPRGPVLVSVASYTRGKRPGELLEALAPFLAADRSAILVLVGHPFVEPDVTGLLRSRPAALGIDDQVIVTGWMSRSDIRDLLAWAAASIINSRSETQCLAVYEALAANVPVLISAIPALTSQFPSLPAHADDEELRSNLARVLADQAVRDSLFESSRERLMWADIRRHDEIFHSAVEQLLGRPSP